MPARFRDVIFETATAAEASRLVVVPWFGECVRVFPVAGWRARTAKLEGKLSELDSFGYGEDESDLRRLIYGMAIEVPMDGHGRFVLPQHVRDEAAIDREIYWVGLGDFLELWNPERLHERLSGENAKRLRSRLVEMLTLPKAGAPQRQEENKTEEDSPS
ncbi:MAG: division/cell wall cluster transcriptional repressor MraZ [Bradymonadia bacterium]|jgi:division/cell wall cluster transcriptional repressor MraZ